VNLASAAAINHLLDAAHRCGDGAHRASAAGRPARCAPRQVLAFALASAPCRWLLLRASSIR
jgi:hypothetical protein